MAAYDIALAREAPENRRELMRPYLERVEATMARYGGFYRTWLQHRVEVVEGDCGLHLGPTIVEFPHLRAAAGLVRLTRVRPAQGAAPAPHALRRHARRRVERRGDRGESAAGRRLLDGRACRPGGNRLISIPTKAPNHFCNRFP